MKFCYGKRNRRIHMNTFVDIAVAMSGVKDDLRRHEQWIRRSAGRFCFRGLIFGVCLFWTPVSLTAGPVWCPRVVAEYPHDAGAFTQGLLIHDGKMYESTGQYGASSLRLVDLDSGRVRRKKSLKAAYFAEGIAVHQGRIYQLTWRSHLIFVYDLSSFEQIKTVPYDGEGWGLTTDGVRLILSDGTSRIRFLDPETLTVMRDIRVLDGELPVERLNELEYMNGEIWANIWYQANIVRISPEDGHVLGYIDLSGLVEKSKRGRENVLNGIAYDAAANRLFVTGKNWSTLYEIEVSKGAYCDIWAAWRNAGYGQKGRQNGGFVFSKSPKAGRLLP